ncbi:MAG: SHOCT domain-containing protein [Phycisphaerales bacterium]
MTAAQASGAGQIALWSVALMLAAIIGFWFAIWLRKRLTTEEEGSGEGLTLGALRTMHARGELSDEEYDAARAAVLAQSGVDPDKARSDRGAAGFARTAEPGVDLAGDPLPSHEGKPPESGRNPPE